MIKLQLTFEQANSLKWLLVEEAQRQDDDGNEGTFAAGPLKPVYDQLLKAMRT